MEKPRAPPPGKWGGKWCPSGVERNLHRWQRSPRGRGQGRLGMAVRGRRLGPRLGGSTGRGASGRGCREWGKGARVGAVIVGGGDPGFVGVTRVGGSKGGGS